MALLNLVKMTIAGTPGVGSLTLSAAVPPYQTFASAGAVDGASYSYVIVEGATKFECGHGTYSAAGPSLSRDTVFDSSAGYGVKETFSGAAQIHVGALARDTVTAGKQSFFIPGAGIQPRKTDGAVKNWVEYGTARLNIVGLDFDHATAKYAQFGFKMPKSWNRGVVSFRPIWRHGATTTNFNVDWRLRAVALRNALAIDQAFGTHQGVVDTGGSTNTLYVGDESNGITIAGTPQVGDWVQFEIYRNVSAVTGNLAVPATLLGVELFVTTDAENDG